MDYTRFSNGGLILSTVLMVILGTICLGSFQLLVAAQQRIGGSYGDVAQHLYGRYLKMLINFFLCISQMGFVASYLIFISENIGIVVNTVNNCNVPFDAKYYTWIVIAVIVPVCWIRKIARLSYIAILADVFIAFNLVCVLYFTSNQISHNGFGENVILINQKDFGLMIGTATFSYEGIGMILPIVEGMKHPEKFPRVVSAGICISTLVFMLIGAMGYSAYGDITQASVVSNLPRVPLSTTVQVLYSCAMILTCPFMLYPALEIIEKAIFGLRSGQTNLTVKWLKNFVRSLVPIVCTAVSFGVGSSNLDKFVSLVGCVACVPLCFIFPGLFHYKITKNKYLKAIDVLLVVWGLGIMIYTMYITIDSWIHPTASTTVVLDIDGCSS
ncbi:hypothetical protein G6F58_007367 [Rhizopus delemar]|nr:hypothetical protein G6F58_007367 [Rhizopus delemar]